MHDQAARAIDDGRHVALAGREVPADEAGGGATRLISPLAGATKEENR